MEALETLARAVEQEERREELYDKLTEETRTLGILAAEVRLVGCPLCGHPSHNIWGRSKKRETILFHHIPPSVRLIGLCHD